MEDRDVAVVEHEKGPWAAVTPENEFYFFETEDEACIFQRGWRAALGLDQMTGGLEIEQEPKLMKPADEFLTEIQKWYTDMLVGYCVDIVDRRDEGQTLALGYPTGSNNTGFLLITKTKRGIKVGESEYVERLDKEVKGDSEHYASIQDWMDQQGFERSPTAQRVNLKRQSWR
jgi:hypothetical protein